MSICLPMPCTHICTHQLQHAVCLLLLCVVCVTRSAFFQLSNIAVTRLPKQRSWLMVTHDREAASCPDPGSGRQQATEQRICPTSHQEHAAGRCHPCRHVSQLKQSAGGSLQSGLWGAAGDGPVRSAAPQQHTFATCWNTRPYHTTACTKSYCA